MVNKVSKVQQDQWGRSVQLVLRASLVRKGFKGQLVQQVRARLDLRDPQDQRVLQEVLALLAKLEPKAKRAKRGRQGKRAHAASKDHLDLFVPQVTRQKH